jgi:hypothetical protein
MEMREALAKLESILGAVGTLDNVQMMSAEEFVAHAKSEVAKAAQEDEGVARRRLLVLQKNLEMVVKALSFEGTDKVAVEMYTDKDQVQVNDQITDAVTQMHASGAAASVASNEKQVLGKADSALAAAAAAISAQSPQPSFPTAEPAAAVPSEIEWPKDVASPEFLKEGIAKRASEDDWGTDPWAGIR